MTLDRIVDSVRVTRHRQIPAISPQHWLKPVPPAEPVEHIALALPTYQARSC